MLSNKFSFSIVFKLYIFQLRQKEENARLEDEIILF